MFDGPRQRCLHAVRLDRCSRVLPALAYRCRTKRRAQRAARVAGRRRNPDVLENFLAQQNPVGDAVQRHAAREAQVFCAGDLPGVSRHPQDDFLGDLLDRGRQIHFALRDRAFRIARRPAEKLVKFGARHRQPLAIIEILHVHRQRPVGLEVDEFVENNVDIFRFAVGREAHELVFAGIDPKAGEIGERAVKQAERMRKFAASCSISILIAPADADAGRVPFAHAVHRQNGRLVERRREKRAGGVRLRGGR